MTTTRVCDKCGASLRKVTGDFCARCESDQVQHDALMEQPTLVGITETPRDDHTTVTDGVNVAACQPASGNFAGYELLSEVARGGMGVVYRAKQTRLDRVVALKMILAGRLASDADIQRFYTEAEAAAKLQHPNIVRILDIGEQDGQHYFTMDFIEGRDLAVVARQVGLTTTMAADYVRVTAEAIHYAHEQGILHRDIKPANILIDEDNQPQVTDFGLAKKIGTDSELTGTGQIVGTPAYMPPEQASGDSLDLCRQSDVYSLGAILYELLTGRPPFVGDTPLDTLMQVLSDPPVSPKTLNPNVSRDLETICLKCLQKDPKRRYATAQQLAEELSRVLTGKPILARPISTMERVANWCKRRPAVATLGALLGLLVTVLSISGPIVAYNQSNALKKAHLVEQLNNSALQRASDTAQSMAVAESQQRRLLYANDMLLASQFWDGADVSGMLRRLEQHTPKMAGEDLRGFEWYYLAGLPNRDSVPLEHPFPVNAVAVAPNRNVAAVASAFEVHVWDLHTLQLLRVLDAGQIVTSVVFSPDGEQVAIGTRDHRIVIWNAQDGQQSRTISGHTEVVSSVAFSPDGSYLASGSWDDTVRVWNTATGTLLKLLSGHEGDVNRVRFSRDGRFLFSCSSDRTVRIWSLSSLRTGNELRWKALPQHPNVVFDFALSPDGSRLATSCHDGKLRVYSVVGGKLLAEREGSSKVLSEISFSPKGDEIAAGCFDNRIYVWETETYHLKAALTAHTAPVRTVAYTAAGRLLSGCYRTTVRYWHADATEQPHVRPGHSGVVTAVSHHPRQSLIASADDDGRIQLQSADSSRRVEIFHESMAVTDIDFSTDGQYLAATTAGGELVAWDVAPAVALLDMAGTAEATRTLDPGTVAPLLRRRLDARSLNSLSFSHDGRIAVGGEHGIMVFDIDTQKMTFQQRDSDARIATVAFAPHGRHLAWCSWNGALTVWDLDQEKELFQFKRPVSEALETRDVGVMAPTTRGESDIWTAIPPLSTSYSPNGKTLAVLFLEGTLNIVDAEKGIELGTVKGQGTLSPSLAFSPDGRSLLSSGTSELQITDVAGTNVRARLKGPPGGFTCTTFSPDGELLVGGGRDGALYFFRAASIKDLPDELIGFAERLEILSSAITANPDDHDKINQRADLYCRSGRWSAAIDDFQRLLTLEQGDSDVWYRCALACLWGEHNAYQQHSEDMLERFQESSDAATLLDTALACVASPQTNVSPTALDRLVESARKSLTDNVDQLWQLKFVHSLVDYRNGRSGAAARRLQNLLAEESNNQTAFRRSQAGLVLAMAYYKLGRARLAAQNLATALVELDRNTNEDDYGPEWQAAVLSELLADEATATMTRDLGNEREELSSRSLQR